MKDFMLELFHTNVNMKHICCIAREYVRDDTYTTGRSSECSALMFFDGRAEFSYDGKKATVCAGDVLFIPAASVCSYKILDNKTEIYTVSFALSGENDKPIAPFDTPTLIGNEFDSPLRESFARCVHLFCTSTNHISLKSAALALFSQALLLFAKKEIPKSIQMAVDTIRNNIHGELRISELADASGMSESTFRREFHRYAGISPKQYILECKLHKAKQMLRAGDYSIKEICNILGFYDDAYFSKLFKKATGFTPMQYAQSEGEP